MHPIIKKIRNLMRQCSPRKLTAEEQATLDAIIVSVTADKTSFGRTSVLEQHPDDAAVDRFASAMKAKLALSRGNGHCNWQDKDSCDAEWLSELLHLAVARGDPLEAANYAMMLHQRRQEIAPPATLFPLGRQISAKVSPFTVSLCPENPRGVRVLVWRNAECVYSQAHPFPTGDAIPDPHIEADLLDSEAAELIAHRPITGLPSDEHNARDLATLTLAADALMRSNGGPV